MTRILLDTSAYSAMRRGDRRLLAALREAAEVILTPVVLGELLFGFRKGKRERENRAGLREFVESPRVTLLTIDDGTAERYALLREHLQRDGVPVATNDLWIAASAAQHGLRLVTLDKDFTRIPHLLLDYYEPLKESER